MLKRVAWWFSPRNPRNARRWQIDLGLAILWLAFGAWQVAESGRRWYTIGIVVLAVLMAGESMLRRHYHRRYVAASASD